VTQDPKRSFAQVLSCKRQSNNLLAPAGRLCTKSAQRCTLLWEVSSLPVLWTHQIHGKSSDC
jgi:hypothetical protein